MVTPRFPSIPPLLGLLFFAAASGSAKVSAAGLGLSGHLWRKASMACKIPGPDRVTDKGFHVASQSPRPFFRESNTIYGPLLLVVRISVNLDIVLSLICVHCGY